MGYKERVELFSSLCCNHFFEDDIYLCFHIVQIYDLVGSFVRLLWTILGYE